MDKGGLCESCLAPGFCCREIHLFNSKGEFVVWDHDDPVEELTKAIGEHWFSPLASNGSWEAGGQGYQSYTWRCSALDNVTGRCTVYDRRPHLCRDYLPGSSSLCIHYIER